MLRTYVLDDTAFSFGSSLPTALEWVHYVGTYKDSQIPPSVNWDYDVRFHQSKSESSGIFISLPPLVHNW